MTKQRVFARRVIQSLAFVVAVLPSGRVDATDEGLNNCVQVVHPVPLSQLSAADDVGTSQDIGNVTVMELSGDYDRGLDVPRQEVATRFYATHPDQYDFLIVFTTFEFPTPGALAFYNGLRNDTQGIGQPIFDDSAYFGSAGKLQGYIDMAAMSRYDFVPDSPIYSKAFDTLSHEIMHRWGVHLHFIDSNGNDSSDLLGQTNVHWSYFLDTDASVMYGNDWQIQDDGKFHSVDTRHRYSPLDMYVAGFAAQSEVPPFTLIRNGDGGVATDLPKLGAVSAGQGETITIDQVVAASGERIPSAADSQKDFTGAVILLKRPGEIVSANLLLELERFRVRYEQQFVANTNGRGTIRLFTQSRDTATAGLPTILHGSGNTTNLGGVAAAVAWLESRQTADGHWQDRQATAMRDTVAVIRLLDEIDPAFAGLAAAHSWVSAHTTANLDQHAWKLLGADLDDDADALAAAQDSAGGFAINGGWTASAFDTSVVAAALAHHDSAAPSLDAALGFVGTRQNADGSYGATDGGHGRVLPTLRAANLLASSDDGGYATLRQRAADWISTQQAADGGIGGVQQASLAATVEVYSLSGRLPLSAQVITGSRSYVAQNQQTDGDWGGSVYLTATAALAYAHDQLPNLALVGAPAVSPAHPYDGALATLSAVVANTGSVSAPATVARWYDGDPDQGGVQIGADIAVANLAAGSSTSIIQSWDTSGRLGDHVLWLMLDADNTVNEASELDNHGSLAVNVQAPSDLPDLALNSSDFSLNPASVTTLPSQIHLSGLVRNIGNQDSGTAVIRLYAKPDLTTALAETALNVPARGSAQVDLDFNVTLAATLDLLVRVDPDNAISEADESNNDASLTLPYGQSLDLEVTPADIAQTGAPPLAGHDVNFDVNLHNRGTIDAPPAVFHADIVQNGVTTTIFDAPVQIAAGQSVAQHLTWRPDQPGAAQLRVSLDPTNQIVEAREDNNAAQLDFDVAAQDQADLTFVSDSLVFDPTPGLQGQPLSVSLGVSNLSSVATGSFRVALYAADPRTGAPALGSTMVATLAGSSNTTVTINVADLGITGDRTLYAFIDADNQIAEIDETNNVIIKPLHVVPLADVAISVADVELTPALPVPGQPVEAKIAVRNLGGQDAHGVVVRLLEGDATTGTAVGADQTIDALAAGATTTLTWDWTLGVAPDARSVTAIADPDDTVREGSEDNNIASLPFDVQDSNFFASERYISPNGDGVQDASAIVFVMPQAGPVEVDVVNGAQYTVRHFANVELNGDLRGQVIWDGRDDRGRIVPDGDYQITAIDAEHQNHIGPQVTVDNNLSSFLEAVDTPYGINADLPLNAYGQSFYNTQVPPITSPLRDQLFGFWTSPASGPGLYRTDTVFPNAVPVVSGNWLEGFRLSHQLESVSIDRFEFDPIGQNIVITLNGNSTSNGQQTWILETAIDQSDSPVLLATLERLSSPEVLGFFDQGTVVVGPTPDALLHTIDTTSGSVSVLRSLSDAPYYDEAKVFPLGILLVGDGNFDSGPQHFVPRDPAKAIINFHSMSHPDNNEDYSYSAQLSPGLGSVAVYERDQQNEVVDLIDLASGTRKRLLQSPPAIARLEQYGIQTSMPRYGMGWLEHENELLVQDATARTAIVFSESGQRQTQVGVPALQRVGDYELGYGQESETSDPANVFPAVSSNLLSLDCSNFGTNLGIEHRVYDPTTARLYLTYGETIAYGGSEGSGHYFVFNDGIRDLYRANIDSGQVDTEQQGTLTPLIERADIAQHPLRDECADIPPGDWPVLMLGDGARVRTDGHVQTLSRGVLSKIWKYDNYVSRIWPDETRMLSGNQSFSSLLNLTAILQARTLGRGIELSGVAADRNFAYFKLDWAPIEQPNNWQVLTPASSDEVFLDEFLTWVPPQPGTFLIRLTIVDKAGNATTSTTTASSFDSSSIDNFSLTPRYISPNGDGVQDQLIVKYRVRAPMTLDIRIDDNDGNTVRSLSRTYDNSNLGPQEFDWDGRNDGGHVVPDGRYRINVDGFAAWVTVDTLAPKLTGTLTQPYQPQGTADQSGISANYYAAALPAAKHVVQEVNLDRESVERSPKGSAEWHPAVFDPRGDSGRAEFGLYTYRVTASDRAGNTTTLNLGPGEEQLITTAIGRGAVRYQTPPVTGLLNVDIEPPIVPVAVDQADDDTARFVDESGYLVRVAVETAPFDTPDQWTQRGIADIGSDCPPGTVQCKASFSTMTMPLGAPAFLRLRGERADGSVLYSNQGYITVGGIDPPVCDAILSSDAYIHADEYFDGPLAQATLHYISKTGVPSQANIVSPDDVTMHFVVPSDPKSAAWVGGIDQHGIYHISKQTTLACPVQAGGDGGGSAWQFTLRPYPVVSRDQCDGQPGNQIALGFRTEYGSAESLDLKRHEKGFVAPIPTHLRLSYVDGITNLPVTLFDGMVDESNVAAIGRKLSISTLNWPEGSYEGRLEATGPDGTTRSATVQMPVLKQAPQSEIVTPPNGGRVCALPGSAGESISLALRINSPAENAFHIEIGSGAHPVSWRCLDSAGALINGLDAGCAPLTSTGDLIGESRDPADPVSASGELEPYNGTATLRLRSAGWSGGSTCVDSTVYLDSDVEFAQRKDPTSVVPPGADLVGISAVGDQKYAQASFFFKATEPVTATATVRRLETNETFPLSHFDDVQGDVDLAWNGLLDGSFAPDGRYTIDVVANDECTHPKTLTYQVLVDSTPPAVELTSPVAGPTGAAIVHIAGSITDSYQLSSWSLDYALAGSPGNWQNLANGKSPIANPTVLADWSRGSLTGAVDLRLSAIDVLGNRSETHIPIVLQDPAKLIGGAELQPPLFSPNVDGALDSTRLQLSLLRDATVAIHVESAAQGTVAGLYSGASPTGSSGFVWNGQDSDGHVVPDGVYSVVVDASDPNGIAAPETATLTATVDTLAPVVTVQQPTGAFAPTTSSVKFHTEDLHFTSYEATLTRSADGVVAASANGTQGGDITLTALKDFQQGAYALHIVARDGAGNVTTRDTTFNVDSTLPVVSLTSPDDAALIAAAKSASVTGSVNDANLASYALSVAPDGSETWTDLKQGTANIDAGEILAWTPNLSDGIYRLRLRGVDQAGNTTDVIHSVEVDGTPPMAKITSPVNGSLVRTQIEIDGSATDEHFATYRISIATTANAAAGQWSDVYSGATAVDAGKLAALTLNLPEDNYVLRLTATDKVGLSSTDQVNVRIDTQPPPVPLGLVGHVENHRDAVLDWNAVTASDLAGYNLYRNGEKITPSPLAAIHYADTNAPEGQLTYDVTAVDQAGNESAPSNNVSLLIDHTPPTVTISRPASGERVRGVYDIVGTAYSQDDFKQYRLSAQPLNPPGSSVELASGSLPVQGRTLTSWSTLGIADETTVRIHLEGEDTSGNTASADVDVVVDNGPPAAPTGLTAVLTGVDTQANWDPNSESDLLGYLLYRDNQLVNATTTTLPADLRPFALTDNQYLDKSVPDGTHTYVVYAIDKAGNVSLPSSPASLDPIDNHAPSLVIESPAANTKFETSITVFATSPDSDIVQVQFAWRPQGNGAWTNFGSTFTDAPYRILWTPPTGTPYGTYQIRALATDLGGLSDPNPPVVNVIYADLTPPDTPVNVTAVADADTVHVAWSASTAPDVAGYRVYRNGSRLFTAPIASTSYDDPSLSDDGYTYTINAVDAYGNESDPSDGATAHVFGVSLDQPFSPTSDANVDVHGFSARAGSIALHVDTDQGSNDSTPGSTAADGSIVLSAQALTPGGNHLVVRVTDADGNRSRSSEVWVDRGAVPAAPTGISADVNDHDVVVSWNANSEPDLLGYRVFRDGLAVQQDAALGEVPTATDSGDSSNPGNAVDGDPVTYWSAYTTYSDPDASPDDPALEIDWTQPRIITAINLNWLAPTSATGNMDLYAWSGHTWISVARLRGAAQQTQSIVLAQPYRTTRIKLVVHDALDHDDGSYYEHELTELQLIERPVQGATTLADTLTDGTYHYQVSAISNFAFESPQSDEAVAAVGDTQGPGAVTLSGDLLGNNANLSWTASEATDVARYDLLRDGNVIASIDAGDALAYTDPNLAIGPHDYVVYAYDGYNNVSDPSNTITLTVTGTGPGIPVNVVVSAPPHGGALDISWQPAPGETPMSYVLLRATSVDGPYTAIAQPIDTSYHDAPLINGTTYYYEVEAVDSAGNISAPSAPAGGTPNDHVPPSAPVLTFPTNSLSALSIDTVSSDVCGASEPGATIELDRDGVTMGSVIAAADYATTPLDYGDSARRLLAAPDGKHVAVIDNNGTIQVLNTANPAEVFTPGIDSRLQQWAAHGATLYFVDAGSDDLYRWKLGQTPELVSQSVTSVGTFAVNSAETALVIAGDYAQDGTNPVSGVWLTDISGGVSRRIGTIDPTTLNEYFPPLWSPDGKHFLLGNQDEIAYIVDATSGDIIATMPLDTWERASWNRTSTQFAFARENAQDGDDVLVYDMNTQTETTLSERPVYVGSLAWSPADDKLAVVDENSLDIISSQDGTSILPLAYPNLDYLYNLVWTPAGAIIADNDEVALRIDPAGWFCKSSVGLVPGANRIRAIAADTAGNHSIGSAPIELDRPATDLPDLAIASTDIFFLPPTGTVGQNYSVLMTLRNLGTQAVSQPVLAVTLTAPDASQQTLMPTSPLSSLQPGDAESVTYALGVLDTAGSYRIDAVADPAQLLSEADESNNRASAALALSADGKPTLELILSRNLFAPGDVVDGEVAVINPGTAFNGHVHVDVTDSTGAVVTGLGDLSINALDFGQRWNAPVTWDAQGVLAGNYNMRAHLYADDGTSVAAQTSAFTIASVQHIQLTLTPDATSQTIGQQVGLHSALEFSDGNAPLAGATLRVSALDPDGTEVWHSEQTLGTLLPGAIVNRDDIWPTAGLAEGVYTLVLSVASADYNATTDATVTLVSATPAVGLSGSLAFDPGTTLIAGDSLVLDYHVTNPGTTDLTGIQARLRIVTGQDQAPVSQTDTGFDLAAGATQNASLTLTAPPLALVSHLAILEARLPGDPTDQWRLLAQQGFAVVDMLPPVITVLSPPSDVVQPAVVPFLASIMDVHSTVADAEVSVDGGNWQPVSVGIDGNYARGLTGLSDGPHTLSVRASDTWGNQAQTDPQAFSVDATPPLIVITGVSDGDAVNHSVVPQVVITDTSLATSDVRLNGDAFVSGTSVDPDGDYVLTTRATDAAGNQSVASMRFTIDRVPPAVAIVAPADGATVYQDAIHVDVQTEAAADVSLTVGSYTASAVADDQGLAGFDAVPMTVGANQIQASAKDRAANVGGPVAIGVTYDTMAIAGNIGPLDASIARGIPLDAPYAIHNNGNIDMTALSARIELRPAAGGDAAASDDFTVDLPAGGNAADTRQIATTSLTPGDYTVVLMVDMPATPGPAGWVDLDSASTSVFFDPCRSRGNDVIFADGFEGGSAVGGDEIFCNGFETLLDGATSASLRTSPLARGITTIGNALLTIVNENPAIRAIELAFDQRATRRRDPNATQRLPVVVPVAAQSMVVKERFASAILKPRRRRRPPATLVPSARGADSPSDFDNEYGLMLGDIHVSASSEFGGLR